MIYVVALIAVLLIVAVLVAVGRRNHTSESSGKTPNRNTASDPWLAARHDDACEAFLLPDDSEYEILFPQEERPQWTT